jgi:hypothetical protein
MIGAPPLPMTPVADLAGFIDKCFGQIEE